MALKAVLLLATVALVSSQSSCNTDDRDCRCADKSFQDCQEPVTADMIHVADLAECKFQCDLFNSFGACDWFVYEQTGGMDENCHLFGPGKETMADYLSRYASYQHTAPWCGGCRWGRLVNTRVAHALVSSLSNGKNMRPALVTPLTNIQLHGAEGVDGVALVRIDSNTEETRVGVDQLVLVPDNRVPQDTGVTQIVEVSHVLGTVVVTRVHLADLV